MSRVASLLSRLSSCALVLVRPLVRPLWSSGLGSGSRGADSQRSGNGAARCSAQRIGVLPSSASSAFTASSSLRTALVFVVKASTYYLAAKSPAGFHDCQEASWASEQSRRVKTGTRPRQSATRVDRAGPRNKLAEHLNTRLSGIVGPNPAFQGTLHGR